MTTKKQHLKAKEWELEILPLDEVKGPGTYYTRATGGICRIPEEALKADHSPAFEILVDGDNRVVKLSDDPFIPLSKARLIAADADLEVNF